MYRKLAEQFQSRLMKGSFAHNVVTLMSGTSLAQLLAILASPILTRLYSPADFGIYALYNSVLGILAILACWRYEPAIVLPDKDEDAASLFALSVIICTGMTVLTVFLVVFLRVPFARQLHSPELASWLCFLPLSLFVAGLFQALNYWSTRRKKFRLLAIRQITRSSLTVFTQFATGTIHAGPLGLITGSILGQLAATIRLAWVTWVSDRYILRASLNRQSLKVNASNYRRFPLYMSIAGILNNSSAELPLIFIAYFFDPSIAGFFILGRRMVEMPLAVVQEAIAQVFFPKASDAYRDGSLGDVTLIAFSKLLSFILVPISLLMIAGPDLIAIVFGDVWRTAGVFLVWIAPRILAQFISSPLSSIFLILQRQDLNLKVDSMLFVSNILFILIGGVLNNYLLSIKLYGIGTFICYSIACLLIFKVSAISFTQVLRIIISSILRAIRYIILPFLVLVFINNPVLNVAASILCGCLFMLFNARELVDETK